MKTRKRYVLLWERIKETVEETVKENAGPDESVDIFLDYALGCEVMSQVLIVAASHVAEKDMSDWILQELREDREFINAYKKLTGKRMADEQLDQSKGFRFYMKGADA